MDAPGPSDRSERQNLGWLAQSGMQPRKRKEIEGKPCTCVPNLPRALRSSCLVVSRNQHLGLVRLRCHVVSSQQAPGSGPMLEEAQS